ncbi:MULTISPECIES: 8-amino-7-oxononanoate synthase [Morganella]|uniref:8-amino-7-oxononanoate synthase n=1 Tax=Morganella TaxID=581 RepID=UPI00128B93F1|nr:8-amino-7-oxononanoate synthase [Morganella morganii]MBT0310117.1 8-amino-7-oxononanoate synthase [Morganella morganii subsp. morganii]MBT0316703.1 8-amino-7-oxononanoate synthase [Morganella morganii subsp. morganii]MBT0370995.1 8-amino-7-oxononanoate synthase [Morganella morganii subsp. morganii]MBT0443318.1 8-amino-7-oxononanoate synthase [Morganella morganii subsp. morganii]MCU6353152.1 8-amino-7-oxononanoate synthase [Morganella morganii]
MWQTFLSERLQQAQEQDAVRRREANDRADGRTLLINGRRAVNFSGNDYLGLSRHPAVIRAWCDGTRQYGVGSGGSGHVTGYTTAHRDLEQMLAEWLGFDRAILFVSGFSANQAVITALMQRGDHLICDKLAHASIMEAAMHSPAEFSRFHHNDTAHLSNRLSRTENSTGKTLVVTEGIFSMDGDAAPLAAILPLTRQHNARLMADDAHGIGVCGREGRGSCDAAGIRPDIQIVTFGKAVGVSGAAVLCDAQTADYLTQYARHLIYSTTFPAAQACAIQAAVQEIRRGDGLRDTLAENIRFFRERVAHLPLQLLSSASAIQPLIVGDNRAALALSHYLQERGLWVKAIRPPTVPPNTARLRITLTSAHHRDDITQLTEALDAFCRHYRPGE